MPISSILSFMLWKISDHELFSRCFIGLVHVALPTSWCCLGFSVQPGTGRESSLPENLGSHVEVMWKSYGPQWPTSFSHSVSAELARVLDCFLVSSQRVSMKPYETWDHQTFLCFHYWTWWDLHPYQSLSSRSRSSAQVQGYELGMFHFIAMDWPKAHEHLNCVYVSVNSDKDHC